MMTVERVFHRARPRQSLGCSAARGTASRRNSLSPTYKRLTRTVLSPSVYITLNEQPRICEGGRVYKSPGFCLNFRLLIGLVSGVNNGGHFGGTTNVGQIRNVSKGQVLYFKKIPLKTAYNLNFNTPNTNIHFRVCKRNQPNAVLAPLLRHPSPYKRYSLYPMLLHCYSVYLLHN